VVALILWCTESNGCVFRPGTSDYSRLSVACSLFADTSKLLEIPRTAFRPPPKVDSAVVILRPRPDRAAELGIDYPVSVHGPASLLGVPCGPSQSFDGLLRECFAGRNKTLRALFSSKSFARRALARVIDREAPIGSVTSNQRSELPPERVAHMREALVGCLTSLGLSDARPNALGLAEFVQLHDAMVGSGVVWK
jgi:16S rRNA A1518/A1519 N6-dimethyltransferase RsmA/KsgA/DIM1 with predicted DNA glycosylase/AP lyase activity